MENFNLKNFIKIEREDHTPDIVENLQAFQDSLGKGKELTCLKDIIDNIKRGNKEGAKKICDWECSTINKYPELKKILKENLYSGEKNHPWLKFEEKEWIPEQSNEEPKNSSKR